MTVPRTRAARPGLLSSPGAGANAGTTPPAHSPSPPRTGQGGPSQGLVQLLELVGGAGAITLFLRQAHPGIGDTMLVRPRLVDLLALRLDLHGVGLYGRTAPPAAQPAQRWGLRHGGRMASRPRAGPSASPGSSSPSRKRSAGDEQQNAGNRNGKPQAVGQGQHTADRAGRRIAGREGGKLRESPATVMPTAPTNRKAQRDRAHSASRARPDSTSR